MSEMTIYFGNDEELLADALAVRRQIFIEEQGVPEARELDGLDGPITQHYVGYVDAQPIAVARTRPIYLGTDKIGSHDLKIERVGVVEGHRGQGLGRQLMTFILNQQTHSQVVHDVVLESQLSAQGFYEALGFIATGDGFVDAGIPHRRMYKPIHTKPLLLGQRFPTTHASSFK